jgi:hypothetical protein
VRKGVRRDKRIRGQRGALLRGGLGSIIAGEKCQLGFVVDFSKEE